MSAVVAAAVGGMLLGGASALLLHAHGRIAGISGILGGLVRGPAHDRAWRAAFVLGLVLAGVVGAIVAPSAIGEAVRSPLVTVLAGLLVGVGTRMGNGCTSGHGVCGLGRLSVRSLVAVATFMTTGVIAAVLGGGRA